MIVAKSTFVVKARKLTLGEHLDGILGPAVDGDFREESERIGRDS